MPPKELDPLLASLLNGIQGTLDRLTESLSASQLSTEKRLTAIEERLKNGSSILADNEKTDKDHEQRIQAIERRFSALDGLTKAAAWIVTTALAIWGAVLAALQARNHH